MLGIEVKRFNLPRSGKGDRLGGVGVTMNLCEKVVEEKG